MRRPSRLQPIPSLSLALLVTIVAGCARFSAPGSVPPGSVAPGSASPGSVSATPIASGVEPTVAPTTSPVPTSSGAVAAGLALIRQVEGVGHVFVVDADGTVRQVSGLEPDRQVSAVRPLWSPDRTMIAFLPRAIGSGESPQLWLVDADGSNERAVFDAGESISWSPDSHAILFQDSVLTTDTRGQPARIWVLNVKSGEAMQVAVGEVPAWLPSGEEISYVPLANRLENTAVSFVVAPVGGQPRPLTEAHGLRWSPDGTAVAIEKDGGIHLADVNGTNVRHLVDGFSPVWSPDGSRLAYVQGVTREEALPIIGLVDRDGKILWSGVVAGDPVWSPDGSKLAVEVGYPDVSIQILDAATGQTLFQLEGQDPSW